MNTAGASFAAPDHEYPSHLELRLTATDAGGNTDTVTRRLDPQTVDVTVASNPPGLALTFNDDSGTSAITSTVIRNSANTVSAPSPQNMGGIDQRFAGWSDGGAQTHTLTAPPAAQTFTANFTPILQGGPRMLTYVPVADARVQEDAPGTNFGTGQLRTDGATDPDTETYLRFLVAGAATDRILSAKLRLYSVDNTVDGPACSPPRTAGARTRSPGTIARRRPAGSLQTAAPYRPARGPNGT